MGKPSDRVWCNRHDDCPYLLRIENGNHEPSSLLQSPHFPFKDPRGEKRFSKTSVLIFTLALLWALWIGLDAVVTRFFTSTDDFKFRWAMWGSTFQIWKDFPLLGSGLGTFVYIFPMYRTLHIEGLATHAEMTFYS